MNKFDPLERISELCDERNWSYYQLAKASGIAYSTLNTMINKHNVPTLPTLQKLCNAFGISIAAFFEPDHAQRGLTKDQAECLSLYTSLPAEDKPIALAFLKGLSKKI